MCDCVPGPTAPGSPALAPPRTRIRCLATDDRSASLLPASSAFNRNKPITPQLTKVLEELAQTGRSRFEWTHMKALIGAQIIQVCNEYNATQPDVGALAPLAQLRTGRSLLPPARVRDS
jgi:hypothetical protein